VILPPFSIPWTNTLAYYGVKSLITLSPGSLHERGEVEQAPRGQHVGQQDLRPVPQRPGPRGQVQHHDLPNDEAVFNW
jgi:hypothetical protein